jgi:decaprenyl-phosphate phosphoribosyltransferase
MKNAFALPGVVVAWRATSGADLGWLGGRLALGALCLGLVASSNYVINELLDAPFDRQHPTKRTRPVPSGRVNVRWAYVQWLALGALGVGLGTLVSVHFVVVLAVLWGMGCVYNIPPARTKDLPFVDVLSEAVNNPLRLLAGWYLVTNQATPPLSMTLCYWMLGCYLMAIKRFAEYRDLDGPGVALRYRKSFGYYTEQRLLVSITFYGCLSMLAFGAFAGVYRRELLLAFPCVAFTMAIYLNLGFAPNSPAEHPEKLYREPVLMATVVISAALMVLLVLVDLPFVTDLFTPGLDLR